MANSLHREMQKLFKIMSLKTKESGSRRNIVDKKEQLFSIERRRVLIPLVNRHKSKLKEKLPGINIAEVVDSVELIFKKYIEAELNGTTKKWFNTKKDIVITSNFKNLEEIMGNLRRNIRINAIKNINESTRSSSQKEQAIAASLVIGGIDPRFEEHGGDVKRSDLKDGVLVVKTGTQLRKEGLPLMGNERLSTVAKQKEQGFQIGHLFGPGVQNITAFTGVHKGTSSPIVDLFSEDVRASLLEKRDEAVKKDVKVVYNQLLFDKSGRDKGTITITIAEPAKGNRASGTDLGIITNKFMEILKTNAAKELLLNLKASPTILDSYKQGIIKLFVTGKQPTVRKNASTKFTYVENIKLPVYSPKFTTTPTNKLKKAAPPNSDLHGLIDLINTQLHDETQRDMGKGNSKQKLNYQKGRFAKSAKVINLLPSKEKGAITADVRYMKDPYAVFEKGGRLYKPLRDPKGIFGRSIRNILRDNKIADLRRVKVNTRD